MRKTLPDIRREIDQLDDQIVDLLAARFALVDDVVAYKKANGLPAILQDRVDEVLDRNADHAARVNVDPALVRAIYTLVIDKYIVLEEQHLN